MQRSVKLIFYFNIPHVSFPRLGALGIRAIHSAAVVEKSTKRHFSIVPRALSFEPEKTGSWQPRSQGFSPPRRRRACKDPGIAWSHDFQTPRKVWCNNCLLAILNRCDGAVGVRTMTGILRKNAFTADSFLNSLLNSSPLIKCYLITPNSSGSWKSRDRPMPGSFLARLLLGGEKPCERGCGSWFSRGFEPSGSL